MANKDVILVTGATGKQGGATISHLLDHGGFRLRAMTRNPDGDAAKALRERGVEVIRGDLDDAASLTSALSGVWGVYAVQNTWEAGVEREEEQGKRIARIARERGVQHYVYASVGSAHLATGIPHFDNKFRIEETVRSLGFPSFTIVRPVFFMENLVSPFFLQEKENAIVSALAPTTKLQMIGADDVGRFGAKAFIDAAKHRNEAVDVAGDTVTLPEATAAVGDLLGRELRYQRIPIDAVRQNSEDFALMLEWFERVGYSADVDAVERTWGVRPRTLREWVEVQKAQKQKALAK